MPFEDLMGTLIKWTTTTEALAAVGAQLALRLPGAEAPPEIVEALRAVSRAAGHDDLDDLPPEQAAMAVGMVRTFMHQAIDLLDNPGKAPGWDYTDPAILDGLGRGSGMLPPMMAAAHPDLGNVSSFLDVGSGVGFLSISAANVWPGSTVVGLDPWELSLDRARANVKHAGLEDRITFRQQVLAEIDDDAAFDCAWLPTFFLTESVLEASLPALLRVLRPGGWALLGVTEATGDPFADAVEAVRWIRGGGSVVDGERSCKLLTAAGFDAVHTASPPGPLEFVFALGQRPA